MSLKSLSVEMAMGLRIISPIKTACPYLFCTTGNTGGQNDKFAKCTAKIKNTSCVDWINLHS